VDRDGLGSVDDDNELATAGVTGGALLMDWRLAATDDDDDRSPPTLSKFNSAQPAFIAT